MPQYHNLRCRKHIFFLRGGRGRLTGATVAGQSTVQSRSVTNASDSRSMVLGRASVFSCWCICFSQMCVSKAFYVVVLCGHIEERTRGLTFTRWGWCGLCFWHKPTEPAHSCLLCSCVCFYLYGPFDCISFHKLSRQLSAFSLSSSVLFLPYWFFQLYIFWRKSLSALV